jgi:hypothetical protein
MDVETYISFIIYYFHFNLYHHLSKPLIRAKYISYQFCQIKRYVKSKADFMQVRKKGKMTRMTLTQLQCISLFAPDKYPYKYLYFDPPLILMSFLIQESGT